MPDITMCKGEGCPQKDTCYRFTATPYSRQSYFHGAPVNLDGTCNYFMPQKEKPILDK